MQPDRRSLLAAGLCLGVATGLPRSLSASERTGAAGSSTSFDAAALGVRPDTGRDVTQSLQSAIDQAAARRVPLLLAPGRYIVGGLVLKPGSRLVGVGPATVLQHLGGPALLSASDAAGVSVRDLTLTGGFAIQAPWRGLIEFRGSRDVELTGLTVDLSPATGIVLERCSGRIANCRVSASANAGIFSLDSSGGIEIVHNTIDRIGNNGIQVWRSAKGPDGSTVAFNRISRISAQGGGDGQNGNGINLFRAGGVLVTSNTISDCAFTAVRANSASDVQIASNAITRMGEVAIFVEFGYEAAVVTANRIDGAATGICVTNFDQGGRLAAIQGNLIRNIFERPADPTISGYGIAVEADTSISGNTIENAAAAGLRIGWGRFCRDISATGNVIRRCRIGIVVTDDPAAGSVLLSANLVSGSADGAIRLTNHGRPSSADLISQQPLRGRLSAIGNVAT